MYKYTRDQLLSSQRNVKTHGSHQRSCRSRHATPRPRCRNGLTIRRRAASRPSQKRPDSRCASHRSRIDLGDGSRDQEGDESISLFSTTSSREKCCAAGRWRLGHAAARGRRGGDVGDAHHCGDLRKFERIDVRWDGVMVTDTNLEKKKG